MKSKKSNGAVAVQTLTLTTFTPDKKAEFVKKVEDLKKEVKVFKITDQPTRVKASEFLTRIKKAFSFLDDKRKDYVTPFNEEVKRINNEFKFIQNPLGEMETLIKKEMKRDYIEQERIRQETERKAREEEEKKLAKLKKELESKNALTRAAAENKAEAIAVETEQKIESAVPQKKIYSSSGSTAFRKIWMWEVEDFSKLPEQWKTTNDIMINSAVKSGMREIPGLRIYEDVNVAGGR